MGQKATETGENQELTVFNSMLQSSDGLHVTQNQVMLFRMNLQIPEMVLHTCFIHTFRLETPVAPSRIARNPAEGSTLAAMLSGLDVFQGLLFSVLLELSLRWFSVLVEKCRNSPNADSI